MAKLEELILCSAHDLYNALRPRGKRAIEGGTEAKIDLSKARISRRVAR
jgi:hypothetical protein